MQFPACVSFLLVLILLYIHLYSSTLFCVFFCPQGGFQSLIGPNEKTASSLHCCSKIIFQGIVFYVTAGHFWLTTLLSMYLSSLLLFLQPKDPFKARKNPDKRFQEKSHSRFQPETWAFSHAQRLCVVKQHYSLSMTNTKIWPKDQLTMWVTCSGNVVNAVLGYHRSRKQEILQ